MDYNGTTLSIPLMPATQIQGAIVQHLQDNAGLFALPIPTDQIRRALDLSGEPKDAYGLIVSCADLGDHFGGSQRILVDIRATVIAFTHLNEDENGLQCAALATDALRLVQSITYSLDGWRAYSPGNWTCAAPVISGNYRQIVLEATIPIGVM